MIIFLYGSDGYQLKQAKEDILARYKAKYPSGVNIFYCDLSENNDLDVVESAFKSSSFFNEHKLVICRNAFNKKTSAEYLANSIIEYGLATADYATLVAVENTSGKELAIKSGKLFNLLSDQRNTVREIEPLQGEKLFEWIRKESEKRGCQIGRDAARNIVNLAGPTSWSIINEIEKLTCFKNGEEINAADVSILITPKISPNIFDLIDAIGAKNRSKAMGLLYKELKTGRDPYYILTMIIYQFRSILAVKDLQNRGLSEPEIVQKAKLNPFVVKKILKSPLTITDSTKAYCQLLSFDNGFKTGRYDLEDSLYNLL